MAGRSNSLTICLMSLKNTLKSPRTGRTKLADYIERNSSQKEEHKRIFKFLVDCLDILSDDTRDEDKFVKAKQLAKEEGSKDPPLITIDPFLLDTMLESTDVTELKDAVEKVFESNVDENSTLGTVFKGFVEEENQPVVCGVIKKKSRMCEAL